MLPRALKFAYRLELLKGSGHGLLHQFAEPAFRVLAPIRHVDDDRVRTTQQSPPEAVRGLVGEESLPPVAGHEALESLTNVIGLALSVGHLSSSTSR